MPHADRIVVVAAVVERGGAFLVTRRLAGTHLEGLWEFPGGKCREDEADAACLVREMREELGVEIEIGPKILDVSHPYPDRTIDLHFYSCDLLGEPVPQLGQEMMWVARAALNQLDWPPADTDLIEMLSKRAPGSA